MNRAFIPLAAAATFVAVYRLTPVAPPPVLAAEPAPVAAAAAVPAEAARNAVAAPERGSSRRQASRRRRAVVPVRRAAVRAVRAAGRMRDVYYPGCRAARAAGVAPILRGEPGYRPEMDGDDDGVACEAPRRRR